MDIQQLKDSIPWLVVLVLGVAFVIKEYRQHKEIVATLTAALRDARNDPVVVTNAKAAAESIPQEAFNGVYNLMQGVLTFAGDSNVAALLSELKRDLELVDHDPTNDPAPEQPPTA